MGLDICTRISWLWLIGERLTLCTQPDCEVEEERQLVLQLDSQYQRRFSPVWEYHHVKSHNIGEFFSPRH
jgi:hypothetical protein